MRNLIIVALLCAVAATSAKRLRYRPAVLSDSCTVDRDAARFDCYPDAGVSQDACLKRGCCWKPSQSSNAGVPSCYFPSDFPNYYVVNQSRNATVYTASLYNPATIFRPNIVHNLTAEFITYHNGIKRLRIFDALKTRYEAPIPLFNGKSPKLVAQQAVKVTENGFEARSSDGRVMFKSPSFAPLIFTDQFIQISSMLDGACAYGLGELVSSFQKNFTLWQRYVFYTHDQGPRPDTNLYGTHPFALIMRSDGSAYGLFFLNTNAMDIDLTPFPAITFRTIGGIIDLFMFDGPTPTDVVRQYHSLIAKPAMPPYWSLGFHLCRYGYANDSEVMQVVERTLAGAFPYDVQWVDIDHMVRFLDWTLDPATFGKLPKIVDYIHSIGMRFVNIIDPGISNQQQAGTYPPYDDGHASDVFIKDANGNELEGDVWPGPTVFPDFTHPNAINYFAQQAKRFKTLLDFDGLWLDMNEPSNFGDGSSKGCTSGPLDNPPYVPAIAGGKLQSATVCPSAKQYLSEHYNLHSMYGYFETKTAYQALLQVMPNKRPFILSRSTFAGSGQWTNHWTGDITGQWTDLRYSISQIMNFNMFGIPLVGADVCGFSGPTSEEMCTRWMQLGSFYPFFRNHNDLNRAPQDPAVFSPSAQASMRLAMFSRYELLPYLYTLFYRAHVDGAMVANALLFAFPNDTQTHGIDDQFLWGDAYMIAPVVEAGVSSRSVYFPNATWYVAAGGTKVNARAQRINVAAPLSVLPMYLRGGRIIPSQVPAFTTETSRRNPYQLIVSLDEYTDAASGELFIDDGITQDSIENGQYTLIEFTANSTTLVSRFVQNKYVPTQYSTALQQITVLGLKKQPTLVTVNNIPTVYQYYQANQILIVKTFVSILQPLVVGWA